MRIQTRAPTRTFRTRTFRTRLRRALLLGLPAAWGALAATYELTCPIARQNSLGARIVSSAVFFAVGCGLILHVRQGLLRELREVRAVAGAAQSVLLRPLPPRLAGLALAAGQLSADPAASIGGDLYDVAATDHGVRVVMGDVRGHGLGALATVNAVLGSFREAAHDERELGGVLRRLERTHTRHVRRRVRDEPPAVADREPEGSLAEEFVTVLLLEIRQDGTVYALNCGHPWPFLLRPGAARCVEPMTGGDPMPPLGAFPLPAGLTPVRCGRILPGEGLLLHTDGIEDARDARGRFFPFQAELTETVRRRTVVPKAVIHAVYGRLLGHVGGPPSDDAALLVLRNDRKRVPAQAGAPVGRSAHPVP
ncbi:serine/threonine-protein phosphatase [Streptomyces kunmingensis]|uniref:Serine/threonine-protein phosphatase n=2 Tax=Streptomyces kunmingensis TaxID=68225 RepID=A0ABU6C8M1_9ACTN|nr:PP2C family protein-serine/threonine phosphatase [Streptomyces kunmingensis]MEB3961068.1 serine/threonine-protein phosphatase [Streptomyces kunmingensis]